MLPLVLASASPRRSQLLRELGWRFCVAPTHVAEPDPSPSDSDNPGAYVERLARLKAAACTQEGLIVAADTVVVLEGTILNKPRDEDDAFAMLCALRGRAHHVYTGLCLRLGEKFWCEHETTRVTFGDVPDEFLRAYIQTGEPLDKAGAYGAQGKGALLIERIEGDYFNVVGLPLFRLARMLRERGFQTNPFSEQGSAAPS